jgi:RNase P subunit RPR2
LWRAFGGFRKGEEGEMNDKKSVLIKRELTEFEFYCDKCKTIHTMSAYAIAQRNMGHEIVFTCKCGNKIDL